MSLFSVCVQESAALRFTGSKAGKPKTETNHRAAEESWRREVAWAAKGRSGETETLESMLTFSITNFRFSTVHYVPTDMLQIPIHRTSERVPCTSMDAEDFD